MERMSSGCWRVRRSWLCVDASQKVVVRFAENAMYCWCFGRAMFEWSSVPGTSHSETFEPVDASNSMIFWSDATRRWSLDQRRLVLNSGVTVTLISTSKRPSLLSQTRTGPPAHLSTVAMRSPRGEYFAAFTQFLWRRVCTCLAVARSQTMAVLLSVPATSRVESGEKSTQRTKSLSPCLMTSSYVSAFHKSISLLVPAAIHLPFADAASERTMCCVSILATCVLSLTRHTPTPFSSPVTRYSPFAVNVNAHTF